MLRKAICFLVLTAMTLHCASRLGALSFLYQNRHSIAYSLGLLGEVPITMCNSDYDFSKGIKVESSDTMHSTPWFAQANEINLFFTPTFLQTVPQKIVSLRTYQLHNTDNYCLSLALSIFHPPTFFA